MFMKKYFFTLSFLTVLAIGAVVLASVEDIQYPVKELGNCATEEACKTYCDKSENIEVCISFAEKNNLMSQEELGRAKKFIAAGAEGPGGCTGKDSCEEYCNDISHIDECIAFAEANNLIPPDELGEAKKVQAAIRRGAKPPPCGNKKQCDVYCSEPEHMEECVTFAIEAGFMSEQEKQDAQKMLQAVRRGVKPPSCQGKEACDEYCGNPENMEICMTFAMEAGFMSEEEKQDVQKMLQALKKGIKPPACNGKEECDTYCAEESHFEECLNFAEAAGFMTPEEAEMARKTGGKGPGGCKEKEECEAFCNDPANQETCFNFAKEHGLIPEEELQKMEEGKQQFQQAMQNMPPEVYSCLESAVGVETMAKFKSGEAMPSRDIGDKMKGCFEKNMPQMPPRGVQPGQQPVPCEGENCPPPPPEGVMMPGGPPTGGTPVGFDNAFPPEILQCIKEIAGENALEQMKSGGMAISFVVLKSCYEKNGVPLPADFKVMETAPLMPPPPSTEGIMMPPEGYQQPSQTWQPPLPCEGENCPLPPPEGFKPPSEEFKFIPPSTEPGAGGYIVPGEPVPLAPPSELLPPIEQQHFVPPPPPLEPSPSSGLPPPSLAGIIFWPFIQLFGF